MTAQIMRQWGFGIRHAEDRTPKMERLLADCALGGGARQEWVSG